MKSLKFGDRVNDGKRNGIWMDVHWDNGEFVTWEGNTIPDVVKLKKLKKGWLKKR